MVLIDRPKALNTSAVMRIEIGMAVSEISVARTFIRNRNSTTATTSAASTSTRSTLSIDVSMKVACRNWTLLAVTPCGQGLLDAVELRLDGARQADGVGGRLLLDADDDGGLAHVTRRRRA